MNIFFTARMKKDTKYFYEMYDKKYLNEKYDGDALIIYAAGNTDTNCRYELTNFLIDEGANVNVISVDGNSLLHVILGHRMHDLPKTIELCERLINLGVDINQKDKGNVLAMQWILNMNKYSDDELEPLYDLWFDQDYVDVTTKNKWGYSPLELAQKNPYRKKLAARMLEYVKENEIRQ